MKSILSGVLICCTALLCLAIPVQTEAQAIPVQTEAQAWVEVVDNQLQTADEAWSSEGFSIIGNHYKGFLDNEKKERHSFTLRAGVAYRFLGICDSDCDDLDLTLYDPRGKVVAQDVATDAIPVLELTPDQTGVYQVEVFMVSCTVSPCYYGLGLWGMGSGVGESSGKQGGSYTGRLESGDSTLSSGEYVDYYTFEAQAGQHIIVDLRST